MKLVRFSDKHEILNPKGLRVDITLLKMTMFVLFFVCIQARGSDSLDVNDVSYLWPPVLSQAAASKLISLSQVVSEKVFNEIISYAQGHPLQDKVLTTPLKMPAAPTLIQNWRIVSMRIDPCAPKTSKVNSGSENCLQEIRLVAQPFSYEGVWEFYDIAFHIIFQISEGAPQDSREFKEVLGDLLKLKAENQNVGIETLGIPLRVHPGFKNETFRNKLREILLSRLPTYRLRKITLTGAETESGPWAFFQGLIENQHYYPEPDPTLLGHVSADIAPQMPGHGGTINTAIQNQFWPFSEDHFLGPSVAELFFQSTIDLEKPALLSDSSPSHIFKLKDIIHAFQNPQISNRTNTDCFSCHASMSRGMLLKISDQENAFRYSTQNEHLTLKAVLRNETMTNFRMFGWFGSSPVVADRVIYESANVVTQIEALLKK